MPQRYTHSSYFSLDTYTASQAYTLLKARIASVCLQNTDVLYMKLTTDLYFLIVQF